MLMLLTFSIFNSVSWQFIRLSALAAFSYQSSLYLNWINNDSEQQNSSVQNKATRGQKRFPFTLRGNSWKHSICGRFYKWKINVKQPKMLDNEPMYWTASILQCGTIIIIIL
jgi:hypothetical protein